MNPNINFSIITVLLMIVICTSAVPAKGAEADDPASMLENSTPHVMDIEHSVTPVEKVSPGIFRIGSITLNKRGKSIQFPSHVNMDKGLLEYLIVTTSGKTHESLFRANVQPYDLQIAFLLLGFEGSDTHYNQQGYSAKPEGEPVEISVKLMNNDSQVPGIGVESWIAIIKDNKKSAVSSIDWIFTGSAVVEGRFLAQSEGSVASIFRDPTSMIDNATPGGESDEIWYVNEGTVPAPGTPVTITIKARK